jgi:hypothetical protein
MGGAFTKFLVGRPEFDFHTCQRWLEERHGPKRFSTLNEKSGEMVKFTIGSLVDALGSKTNLEHALQALDPQVKIDYATGLGDLKIQFHAARSLDTYLTAWEEFWANPKHNSVLAKHLNGTVPEENCPPHPHLFVEDTLARYHALLAWNHFWAYRSPQLQDFLNEWEVIESAGITEENIEQAKLNLIRQKKRTLAELKGKWGCPTPPWEAESANLLWNIPNSPAAQVSMLLGIHGATQGSSGACSSFGLILDRARRDIASGEAEAVILGTVDISPTEELVSGFYTGRVAAFGDALNYPFCHMRGTYLAGGACTWVVAAEGTLEPYGISHMGVEILGTGISSDAEHIITPSQEGPKLAIRRAFADAGITPDDIHMWDLHATGTPGDGNELRLIQEFVPKHAYVSARKGLLGHGMASAGAFELTAQVFGLEPGSQKGFCRIPPTGIPPDEVHPTILAMDYRLILNEPVEIPWPESGLICVKVNLGVGGIASCVITRVLPPKK